AGGGAQLKRRMTSHVGRKLVGPAVVRTRIPLRVDDLLRKEVVYGFAGTWQVCGEEMVERAVFSYDDNYVFDGRDGVAVARLGSLRHRSEEVLHQRGERKHRARATSHV